MVLWCTAGERFFILKSLEGFPLKVKKKPPSLFSLDRNASGRLLWNEAPSLSISPTQSGTQSHSVSDGSECFTAFYLKAKKQTDWSKQAMVKDTLQVGGSTPDAPPPTSVGHEVILFSHGSSPIHNLAAQWEPAMCCAARRGITPQHTHTHLQAAAIAATLRGLTDKAINSK